MVDASWVVYANSEEGNLYVINQGSTLKQRIFQQLYLGAAYTPPSLGSDGKIYSQTPVTSSWSATKLGPIKTL